MYVLVLVNVQPQARQPTTRFCISCVRIEPRGGVDLWCELSKLITWYCGASVLLQQYPPSVRFDVASGFAGHPQMLSAQKVYRAADQPPPPVSSFKHSRGSPPTAHCYCCCIHRDLNYLLGRPKNENKNIERDWWKVPRNSSFVHGPLHDLVYT